MTRDEYLNGFAAHQPNIYDNWPKERFFDAFLAMCEALDIKGVQHLKLKVDAIHANAKTCCRSKEGWPYYAEFILVEIGIWEKEGAK